MTTTTIEVAAPYGPATVSFDSEKGVVVKAEKLTKSFITKALATTADGFGRQSSDGAIDDLDLYLKMKKVFGAETLTVLAGNALLEKQAQAFVKDDKNGVLT
jgi:hypothetical protein